MGIFDRIREIGGKIVSAAQSAVDTVVEGVKSVASRAYEATREFIAPAVQTVANTVYSTVQSAREIVATQTAQLQQAQANVIAATMQHVDETRRRLTEVRAAALQEAARKQVEIVRKVEEVRQAAARVQSEVEASVKRMQEAAQVKSTELAAAFEKAPSVAGAIERWVVDAAAGQPRTLIEYFPAAKEAMDKVVSLTGQYITIAGEKVPLIIGGAGVVKVVPGISKELAEKAAGLLNQKSVVGYARSVKADPKEALRLFRALTHEGQDDLEKLMKKTAVGRDGYRALSNYAVREMEAGLAAADRTIWRTLVQSARAHPVLMLFGTISLASLATALGYARKEIAEKPLLAMYTAIDRGNWAEVLRVAPAAKKFLTEIDKGFGAWLLEHNPLAFGIFKIDMDANWVAYDSYVKQAEEAKAKGLIASAGLTIRTNTPDATISLNGTFRGRGVYVPLDVAPGKYIITATAFGYVGQSQEVELKDGETKELSFTLEESASNTMRTWEARTPEERSRWQAANPRIWTQWQATPRERWEPFFKETENIGTLLAESSPQAEVFIGGKDTDKFTPAVFTLTPGNYDVTFRAKGYKDSIKTGIVKAGQETVISAALTPEKMTERDAETGFVSITTEPAGARIWIDTIVMDYPTPTKVDLKPGTHELLIKKEGYEDVDDTITVMAGETLVKEYMLTPIPEEKVWRAHVSSDPQGAKILVDGYFTGAWTPGYVDLLAGTYEISVQKTGYEVATEVVTIG